MLLFLHFLERSITGLVGWRRNFLAFAFGICATLTLAPFFLFPLIIPAFTGLYWLLQGAVSRKRAFWDGWWFGWGVHTTGLYWFCVALLTDVERFAWLLPFALFGVTGFVALYSGVACWLFAWLSPRKSWQRLVTFGAVWTLLEFARGDWVSSFPWNLQGYSFGFSLASLQLASLVGAYGLTFFAVLLGASLALLAEGKKAWLAPAILWGAFFLGLGWGDMRLRQHAEIAYQPGMVLRLVQADITSPHNWNPVLQRQELEANMQLTQSPGLDKVNVIIWSETAVPYVVSAGSPVAHALGQALPPDKVLITGSLRAQGEGAGWKIWNSLVALDHDGNMLANYDKIRLVPFGEFLPMRRLVPKGWTTPVGDSDFSVGAPARNLAWRDMPAFLPLICYEVIFPDMAASRAERPQWLLNITNDAWFGASTGPYQHFNMSQMRAVEQGLPLARAANTGITAMIDGYGRVLQSLPLAAKGVLDVRLPLPLTGTFYSLYGDMPLLALISMVILYGLLYKLRRAREN